MDDFPPSGAARREYRMRGLPMVSTLGLGILFVGLAVVMGSGFSTSRFNPAPFFFVFFFLAGGVVLAAWPLRARVVIEGSRITVRNGLGERSADRSEIEGFRTIQSRNGSYRQLYLKHGGTISISTAFNFDEDARSWFGQLTDLDRVDREALLDQISHEQELGTTPEERLGKLANAKTWSVFLTVISIAAAVALLIPALKLRVPAAVLLAGIPVAAFFLVQRSPLLYAFFKQKADPRAELSICLIVCGFGLILSVNQVHFVALEPLMLIIVPVGLAYFLGFYTACRHGTQRPGKTMALLFFAGLYGWGFAAMSDTIADRAQATTYSADVMRKHVSRGRSTTYYLELSPWGPMQTPTQVSVPARIYGTLNVGDEVCLSLHPGNLHAPWYQVIDCSNRFSPDLTQ